MEALAGVAGIDTIRLPKGKLSFYEEFPEDAAESIIGFLRGTEPTQDPALNDSEGMG